MRNKIITSLTAGFAIAAIIYGQFSFAAANLTAAVNTLPQNEEWSIMAYASTNKNVGQNYLNTPLNSSIATDYEKRILAITAIGQNPATIGSENFVAKLQGMFDGTQIGETFLLNDDIFGILALKSAGISDNTVAKSRAFVLSHQNSDGGWGFGPGVGSDSNTTAMAVAALSLTGTVPQNAFTYISSSQKPGSGYGYTPSDAADGASTAWVMAGLTTAGKSIPNEAKVFLESLQIQGGGFRWMPSDAAASPLVTAYAVIALSGKGIPVNKINPAPTPPPAPKPAPTPVPAPIPQPTPSPITSYRVAITYPGNKIYVGNVAFSSSSPNAMQATIAAMNQINLLYEITNASSGSFVKSINGYKALGSEGWLYAVNGAIPQVSASNYAIKSGDSIQWFYGGPTSNPYE